MDFTTLIAIPIASVALLKLTDYALTIVPRRKAAKYATELKLQEQLAHSVSSHDAAVVCASCMLSVYRYDERGVCANCVAEGK